MKFMSALLMASAVAAASPATAGEAAIFPPAFQGDWEDQPMVCDPADGEGIGTMRVDEGDFVDTDIESEFLNLSEVAPGKIRVRLRDYNAATGFEMPERIEIWTLKDKGQRLHIQTLDQAGKPNGTRERYRCSAQ